MSGAASIISSRAQIHPSARLVASNLVVEDDVVIGPETVIAGDEVHIQKGVKIGAHSDLRSSRLVLGRGSEIGARCRVLSAEMFIVGNASRISRDFSATCRSFSAGDFLYFAQDCSIGYGGTTEHNSRVVMGREVALGPHCILNANYPIVLRDRVGTGGYVTFWTHGFHFGHSALDGFPPAFAGITIDSNVWLGYHVSVLPGVSVGENTIVAAGSVITGELPSNCLAAGVPAKFKKALEFLPLNEAQSREFVISVLENWVLELEWKGLSVINALSEAALPHLVALGPDGTEYFVCYLAHDTSFPQAPRDQITVALTIDARPDLREAIGSSSALFEIRDRRLSGCTGDVVEDLRDFLRRHTLACGTERVFESIEPQAFKRLRSMI